MRTFMTAALLVAALPCGIRPTALCRADTLELKSGAIVEGKYAGGTASTIRLETAEGVQVFQKGEAIALTFSGDTAAPAPAPAAPAPAAAPPSAGAPAAVPPGTVLTVRMDAPVSSNDAPGKKFSAKLVADLMAGSSVVAKAGTTVFGQVEQAEKAGRLAGKSKLAMTLTGVEIGGTIQPILTTNFAEAGTATGKKTVRNVAAGAMIGHAVDDDDGGKKGAAIGAGVSLIRKGDSVTVPAGAILEFRLTQPFQPTLP